MLHEIFAGLTMIGSTGLAIGIVWLCMLYVSDSRRRG